MKKVIDYIDTRGMFPKEDSGYYVSWYDERKGRIMTGFSTSKDFADGCSIVSFPLEIYNLDPIGKLARMLDNFRDWSIEMVEIFEKR